jgi:hypothetical protein
LPVCPRSSAGGNAYSHWNATLKRKVGLICSFTWQPHESACSNCGRGTDDQQTCGKQRQRVKPPFIHTSTPHDYANTLQVNTNTLRNRFLKERVVLQWLLDHPELDASRTKDPVRPRQDPGGGRQEAHKGKAHRAKRI